MTMTSRWFALLAASGACVGLAIGGNACGGDDTTSSSASGSSSANTGGGGSGGAGQGGAGGAGVGGAGGQGGGATSDANCDAPSGAAAGIKLTTVVAVPGSPLMVAAPVGDNDRLFILEQQGRIRLWKDNQLSLFLDIDPKVATNGERGLLGMAFHPDYGNNGRFFVHYSNLSGDTVIAEYRRDPNNPDLADPNPVVEPLLTVSQPYANHNGGSIEFSPEDGYLYIGLGDGGSGNDPMNSGQNKNSLLGALLRLDVSDTSGNPPYLIPAGNITDGALEIFDWGLRNPYRFSFDMCNGDRYIGDVGQDCFEEIDVAASSDGGQNWGWKIMEGLHCRGQGCNALPPASCDDSGMTPPAIEYPQGQGQSPTCDSVTGGVVYRGSAIPWLRGTYFYADFCDGRTWSFRWNAGTVSDQQDITNSLGTAGINISGFGNDNRGEVYITSIGGTIYRIDPQ